MLTGRKFEVSFLLGFHISSGTTRVAFNKSGKMLCSILELIDLVKIGVKKSMATFISFGKMVSIPVAFLEFNSYISFSIPISFKNEKEIFPLHEMKMSRYILFAFC